MTADDRVVDADQTGQRAYSKDDGEGGKACRDERQANHVRFAGTPIAVEHRGGTFPVQIARAMYARTRVENNILNQLCHRLLGVTLHCALVHWQVLSRGSLGKAAFLFYEAARVANINP